MGKFRNWWKTKVRPFFQRQRADRCMPPIRGKWAKGGPVRLRAYKLAPHQLATLHDGATWWCKRLGAHVFEVEELVGDDEGINWKMGYPHYRTIVVRASDPLRTFAYGTSEMHANRSAGLLVSGEIRIRSTIMGKTLMRTMIHELGHALGLGDRVRDRDLITGELRGTKPDPNLLMTSGGDGYQLIPEELEILKEQWICSV